MWAGLRHQLSLTRELYGIERCVAVLLIALRIIALSYWLRQWLPDPTKSEPRRTRDIVIDLYCLAQLLTLILVLVLSPSTRLWPVFIAGYILFEILLNLSGIILLGKIASLSAPPASIERSIILLFVNIVQVTLVFALLYRCALKLPSAEALYGAVLVLGTIGTPANLSADNASLVFFHILCDTMLLVSVLGALVGQLGVFRRPPNPPTPAA